MCVWLSEQVHEGSNIMLQCIVYCCRRQSETTRLLSVNSDLQDKLGSMHQKYSSQLQEGESVGAKVGQRLLYSASFGHCTLAFIINEEKVICYQLELGK